MVNDADDALPARTVMITVCAPDDDGIYAHEFCNWECFGLWAAAQAGFEGYRTPEVAWSHQRWP